jgi:hypothetical protein
MIAIRTREELIENGRYYNCPPNELIFLTKAEHSKIHGLTRKISPRSDFSKKFFEHYHLTCSQNPKLYDREKHWFYSHGKCSWE